MKKKERLGVDETMDNERKYEDENTIYVKQLMGRNGLDANERRMRDDRSTFGHRSTNFRRTVRTCPMSAAIKKMGDETAALCLAELDR